MKKVSKKQSLRNRELDKIRKNLSPFCVLCGRRATGGAHLLPRSLYPEYYTAPWNVVPMCREHHDRYDSDRDFRRSCTDLENIVRQHDELAANRYFKL